ncbi:MAG: DUF1013 domain-containing protein [Alphaproteobacteria bacterium]|nr:DUF1013 domain-containing protein [Alphaproteobacteria bacterium]
MNQPLMPKAAAVWLIENTTLTFDQVAAFCALHPLEIQAIADGEVAASIIGRSPITHGELTSAEIERCQRDPDARLQMAARAVPSVAMRTKGPRYTPLAKRQDKPAAIAWLVRHQPEVSDSQIARLLGTTKTTIQAVRDRSHWNAPNIKRQHPVELGLCKLVEFDAAVAQARARAAKGAGDKMPAQPPAVHTPAPAPLDEPESTPSVN